MRGVCDTYAEPRLSASWRVIMRVLRLWRCCGLYVATPYVEDAANDNSYCFLLLKLWVTVATLVDCCRLKRSVQRMPNME